VFSKGVDNRSFAETSGCGYLQAGDSGIYSTRSFNLNPRSRTMIKPSFAIVLSGSLLFGAFSPSILAEGMGAAAEAAQGAAVEHTAKETVKDKASDAVKEKAKAAVDEKLHGAAPAAAVAAPEHAAGGVVPKH
jgi:hypothetical protein